MIRSLINRVLDDFYRSAQTDAVEGQAASGYFRLLEIAGKAVQRFTPNAQRALDSLLRLLGRPKQVEQARRILAKAEPIGSALKSDVEHRAATWMRETVAAHGYVFQNVGGDGKPYTLFQYADKFRGVSGRWEYIVDATGRLTHQRFVAGGTINGIPNKP